MSIVTQERRRNCGQQEMRKEGKGKRTKEKGTEGRKEEHRRKQRREEAKLSAVLEKALQFHSNLSELKFYSVLSNHNDDMQWI